MPKDESGTWKIATKGISGKLYLNAEDIRDWAADGNDQHLADNIDKWIKDYKSLTGAYAPPVPVTSKTKKEKVTRRQRRAAIKYVTSEAASES